MIGHLSPTFSSLRTQIHARSLPCRKPVCPHQAALCVPTYGLRPANPPHSTHSCNQTHTPGDVSRKRKLLEKQKEGKKRLRRLGALQVPAEVFPELMKPI